MKPDIARVFAAAEEGAKAAGDAFVTTERLLAAIARDGGDAAAALKKAGVTDKSLEIRRRRPAQGPHRRQRQRGRRL